MRNSFADAFYEIAKDDERIYMVAADIGAAAGVNTFREKWPERFLNVGVAEAIAVGFSAGLAMRGCIPFSYTIAPFTIYRPFEQVRVDCCYQNLPVRLVGVGGGVIYSLLGSTHHAQEDVAVMSAIPNMTILAPCDPKEAAEVTRATMKIPGPVYLRLGKVGEPDLTKNADAFQLGKIRKIKSGKDMAFLTYGPIAKHVCGVADRLEKEKNKTCAVYSVHSLKPLDISGIQKVLNEFSAVVVVEEHAPYGGLGPRVKAIAWDSAAKCKLQTYSLKDEFIHHYGSYEDILGAHGLDPETIFKGVLKIG
ncbi:MAG: transketolase family protein [Verrucomicrobiota bacterium]